MPSLAELIQPQRVNLTLEATDKREVLMALAELLADEGEAQPIFKALTVREQLASTGVGSGVAVPHGRISGLTELRAALAIHREGIAFDAVDGEVVHVFVAILAPEGRPSEHLKVLAEVSRLLRSEEVRGQLRAATTVEQARAILV